MFNSAKFCQRGLSPGVRGCAKHRVTCPVREILTANPYWREHHLLASNKQNAIVGSCTDVLATLGQGLRPYPSISRELFSSMQSCLLLCQWVLEIITKKEVFQDYFTPGSTRAVHKVIKYYVPRSSRSAICKSWKVRLCRALMSSEGWKSSR